MARLAQETQPQSRGPDFNGISYEQAQELAQRGIEPPSADMMIRRRVPDQVLHLTKEDLDDTVKVVCFVDTQPWTHERALVQGEQTIIPRKVALLMEQRRQVAIVRDE